jgi:hypothetical protein
MKVAPYPTGGRWSVDSPDVSTFLQRFIAEARRQTSVNTESWAIRDLRRAVSNLSIAFGILAAVLLAFGNFRPVELPAWLVGVLGGGLGVGVYLTHDARRSRLLGWGAFASTLLGVGWLIIAKKAL